MRRIKRAVLATRVLWAYLIGIVGDSMVHVGEKLQWWSWRAEQRHFDAWARLAEKEGQP